MSTASPSKLPSSRTLSIRSVALALREEIRWKILAELATGETRMVKELAATLGRTETVVSKHLAILRRLGIVAIGRGRLYQIVDRFRSTNGQREIDFGHCLVRLDSLG